jgi:hypothetical protein
MSNSYLSSYLFFSLLGNSIPNLVRLSVHMRGVMTVLTISGFVDHQHPVYCRLGGGFLAQQAEPLGCTWLETRHNPYVI